MYIRPARPEDLDRIMKLFDIARVFMQKNGNPTQWAPGYPSKEKIAEDIRNGDCYVRAEKNTSGAEVLHGVFSFILGDDPTYAHIENGAWPSDKPYGTIHRMAGDGTRKGFFAEAMKFCLEKTDNIRIDTHADNLPVQHLANQAGFIRCGIIYAANGTPRIAYQYMKK